MPLNKKTVEAVAGLLKIKPEDFTAQLEVEGESKINDLIKDKQVFTAPDIEVLKVNIQKSGYDEGFVAGHEMSVKEAKKKYGLETIVGKDINVFADALMEKVRKEAGTPDKLVTDLTAEKTALQNTVQALTAEKTALTNEYATYKQSGLIRGKLELALNTLSIDADEALIPTQKQMYGNDFLSRHKIEIVDGREVVYNSAGEKMVDNLQNPLPLAEVVKTDAVKYLKLKSGLPDGGRGGSSSQDSTTLSAELSAVKNGNDLEGYLKNKNIKLDSNEALAIFTQLKKANPDFK